MEQCLKTLRWKKNVRRDVYLLSAIKFHLPALHFLSGRQRLQEGWAELRVMVATQIEQGDVGTWQRGRDAEETLELTMDLV